MKTMTVRNIPDEVARLIKGLSESTNSSVNATVVRVLADSVIPAEKRRPQNPRPGIFRTSASSSLPGQNFWNRLKMPPGS